MMRENVQDLIISRKLAVAVAGATTTTGAAAFLDFIPDVAITKISLMVGILLSIVLILAHASRARKNYYEGEKARLEVMALERELIPKEPEQSE